MGVPPPRRLAVVCALLFLAVDPALTATEPRHDGLQHPVHHSTPQYTFSSAQQARPAATTLHQALLQTVAAAGTVPPVASAAAVAEETADGPNINTRQTTLQAERTVYTEQEGTFPQALNAPDTILIDGPPGTAAGSAAAATAPTAAGTALAETAETNKPPKAKGHKTTQELVVRDDSNPKYTELEQADEIDPLIPKRGNAAISLGFALSFLGRLVVFHPAYDGKTHGPIIGVVDIVAMVLISFGILSILENNFQVWKNHEHAYNLNHTNPYFNTVDGFEMSFGTVLRLLSALELLAYTFVCVVSKQKACPTEYLMDSARLAFFGNGFSFFTMVSNVISDTELIKKAPGRFAGSTLNFMGSTIRMYTASMKCGTAAVSADKKMDKHCKKVSLGIMTCMGLGSVLNQIPVKG